MRRRDFLTLLPVAAGLPALSATGAKSDVAHLSTVASEVDVKRDFGAKGDGVSDDWKAIENAGRFLEGRGGGRMYFPEGRYRLPKSGKNITVRNNIEYYGDGAGSVIVGSNAAFISPNGAIFGRNSYRAYAYYEAHDIVAGDHKIALRAAADADNFSPGDVIIARSIGDIDSPGDALPYFVEMNRVVSVDGGFIQLEDVIDDGWKGVKIAKVTPDVSQRYSIHDLSIECENGFPLFIQASYKSAIYNCWTRGRSVMTVNGFTRSEAHHIVAQVIWSPDRMEALFEIETGSVKAFIHDIEVQLTGIAAPDQQYPLFYCQEFSRRTSIKNVRVDAQGVSVKNVIMTFAGGHNFHDISVIAQSVDKALDYSCGDPVTFSLNHLPTTFKNIVIDTADPTNGFNHGFILYNNHPNGTVENVTVQNSVIKGRTDRGEHNLIWFLRGEQKNILFENVRGAADIKLGSGEDGILHSRLKNVEIRNCEFRRIASKELIGQVTSVGGRQ